MSASRTPWRKSWPAAMSPPADNRLHGMRRMIFVNLPVNDLTKTREFFTQLGFTFNAQFSDDKAACMVINDQAYAMLLSEPFFRTFTTKEVCSTATHTEVLLAISATSREDVDDLVGKALAAGGQPAGDPMDQGF